MTAEASSPKNGKVERARVRSLPSPFADFGRFETQDEHYFFFTDEELNQLETNRSHLVLGTRGTGKTTWLKALEWRQRLDNPHLRSCIAETGALPFQNRFIGVYSKLPGHRAHLFETARLRELRGEEPGVVEPRLAEVYGSYVALLATELLLEALPGLRRAGVLPSFSASEESSLCDDIARLVVGTEHGSSFGHLQARVRLFRIDIEERLMAHSEPITSAQRLLVPEVRGLGSLMSGVGRLISEFVSQRSDGRRKWAVRVLLDEAEVIEYPWHQRAINSLLRTAESPVFYSVAVATAELSTTGTVYAGYELGGADVLPIRLGVGSGTRKRGEHEFERGLLGIVAQRLASSPKTHWANGRKPEFQEILESLYSSPIVKRRYSLNELIKLHVQPGKSARVGLPLWIENAEHEASTSGVEPRYWEWFLIDRLNLRIRATEQIDRKISNEVFRKKQAAAYLIICREMRWTPLYAGFDRLLDVADFAVRDGILAFDQLWSAVRPASVDGFLTTIVGARRYSEALASVGEKKKLTLPLETGGAASPAQLHSRLCELVAFIQSSSEGLKSPEPGLIMVRIEPSDRSRYSDIVAVVRTLSHSGYIRDFEDTHEALKFRLSRALCARHAYSWRIPQYELSISVDTLSSLAVAKSVSIDRIGDFILHGPRVPRRKPRNAGQTELPLGRGNR